MESKHKNILLTCAFMLMFLGSMAMVIVANIAADGLNPPGTEFWQTEVTYQVYPRSMKDTDGDGVGDLAGVKSKLAYLVELGIGVLWLGPFFKSPMADFGYDISDFIDVDPIFGTMEDFDGVLEEAHSLGLKVVMELVPNHSSDEHEWFLKSAQRIEPYTHYYVWANSTGVNGSGDPIPPNNWLSVYGGSAWQWNERRQQFYFHQFLAKQPDLNYRFPQVLTEMNNVIKFWLDRGVDGLRLGAVNRLFEVENVSQNESLSNNPDVTDPNQFENLNHDLTADQGEIFDVLKTWRAILDTYSQPKVMMTEVYHKEVKEVMKYYGTEDEPLADFPFNFNFITNFKNRSDLSGLGLKKSIDKWMNNMPEGKWPNWVVGNHDNPRVSARFGTDLIDSFNIINLLLPGTAITYYGEEIGMEDAYLTYEQTVDPAGCNWGSERYMEFSRDPARTPMQWDNTSFAGFTSGDSTWLPVNENYLVVNVEGQKVAEQSHYKIYKQLAELRRKESFLNGELAYPVVTEQILSFVRYTESVIYLIVINTSKGSVTVNLHENANFPLPDHAEIVIRSSFDERNHTQPGKKMKLSSVPLLGGEGLVFISEESGGH